MPSAVGPEAMRDWLHLHGITRPAELNEGMRVIERYVSFCISLRHPELFEEPPPMTKIAPNAKRRTWRGDPDRMIQCSACGETKAAEGNYYRRNDTMTGWGLKCIACQGKPDTKPAAGTKHTTETKQRTEAIDGLPAL